jgi:hypothetical protein
MSSPAAKSHSVGAVIGDLVTGYREKTTTQLKIIDSFLVVIMLIGAIQFVYCAIVGTFPFNSFLSGFIAAVGCFVLTGTGFVFVMALSFLFCISNSDTARSVVAHSGESPKRG